jgi:hypothetical protein
MHDPPLCTFADLKNGTVSLCDLADMHEAMDEEAEYQRLADIAVAAKGK